jgi:hypothetical protein
MGILVQQVEGRYIRRVFETPEERQNALDEFFRKVVEQKKPSSRMGHLFGLLTHTKVGVRDGNMTANEVEARISAVISMLRDMEYDLKYAAELVRENGQYEKGELAEA